jgi:hypothetical protein
VKHHTEEDLFEHIRTLFDARIKIESNWITQNLLLIRMKCASTDEEIAVVERDLVEMF